MSKANIVELKLVYIKITESTCVKPNFVELKLVYIKITESTYDDTPACRSHVSLH